MRRPCAPDPAAVVLGKMNMLDSEPATYAGPIVDGQLVTEDVAEGFAAVQQAKVPYIVGSKSDELGMNPAGFLTTMTQKAAAVLGAGQGGVVVAAYGSPDRVSTPTSPAT